MAAAPPWTSTSASTSTSTSTSKVSKQSINKAVKALLKWKSTQSSQTLKPSSSDEFLYLVLTLINPPLKNGPPISKNPHIIPLPNPLISPSSPNFNICLLVKDKFSLSSKQKIESELLPISNVIKLSKFRSEFKSFEDKKKLCDSYDAFFADTSLIPVLPKLIGRYFYKRRKVPIGIELGRSDWKEQIEMALGSARLMFQTGTCSVVQVARELMGREKIVENVAAAVDRVAGVVPKKWKNVRAFHLKFTESLAIPIYGTEISNDGGGQMAGSGLESSDGGVKRESNGEVGSDGDGIVGKKRKMGLEKVAKVKQDEVFM